MSPPTTKTEEREANSASFIAIHCGRLAYSRDLRSSATERCLQVRISLGALSSDCEVVSRVRCGGGSDILDGIQIGEVQALK